MSGEDTDHWPSAPDLAARKPGILDAWEAALEGVVRVIWCISGGFGLLSAVTEPELPALQHFSTDLFLGNNNNDDIC